LPHRLSLEGLPRFGPAETTTPAISRHTGAHVSGIISRGRDLVFRLDAPDLARGIYREPRGGGDAEPLLHDPPGQVHVDPVDAGPLLAVHRLARGRVPAKVEAIALYDAYGVETVVSGQAIGVSGDGRVAVVVDLDAARVKRIDLETRQVEAVAEIDGAIDPQLAPQVSLSHDGSVALLMDAREERGDASLERIDLQSGQRERLHGPLPAPSWITAALGPDGEKIVALEVRPGDEPLSRLLRLRRGGGLTTLLELPVAQPTSTPAFVGDQMVALPLSIESYPMASYGPSNLVIVPLSGGAHVPLTRSGDVQGRARVIDGVLQIEGGVRLVRVPIL